MPEKFVLKKQPTASSAQQAANGETITGRMCGQTVAEVASLLCVKR